MTLQSFPPQINRGLGRLGVSGAVAAALVYLLRDEFTTDEAAPITTPRTCEPGPGTLTVVDTGGRLSISGGQLVNINAVSVWADPRIYSANSFTRAAGLAFGFDITDGQTMNQIIGWQTIAAGGTSLQVAAYINGGFVDMWNAGVADWARLLLAPIAGVTYKVFSVLRSSGGFLTADGKILWVTNTLNTASVFPGAVFSTGAATAGKQDNWRVMQLAAPWDTDYGIATNRIAVPQINDTTTSEANALIEMTWQAVTGQVWELDVRRTDDDNRWIIRCDQTGSTIKLIERNAGTETERASAAQTWTNGTSYRLVVIQDGNTIKTFVANVAKNTYTSATFNNTATGIKTSRSGTNLVAWPRTLSGAALAELEKWTS
jgi:hypothetical protein